MSTSEANPNKESKNPRESLKSLIARKKKAMQETQSTSTSSEVEDPYSNASACRFLIRGPTGIVYDGEMLNHKCEWDREHPECPDRLKTSFDRCEELYLVDRCVRVNNDLRPDIKEKVLLKHSEHHYEKLKKLCQRNDDMLLKKAATTYDSIYFNKFSFDSACRAVSSTLNLVHAVAKKEVMNGIALVRPPGHHAMHNEYNGYCFFNNVAIAAESVLNEKLAKKILIVDYDVHHGQGTQQMFYERNDVLYFSIHRYEHGTFWPNLIESNFNYVGRGDGLGYNINVPLNATGLTDSDYLAIVFSILLPVAYEFNPDLIIVSAGYDAAVGCPEGRMNVTPGFYSHLISLLTPLAKGKIAVVVEGGYFIPTLAEGVAMTLKSLLGCPCPILDPTRYVHPTVIDTICNVRRTLYKFWKCFQICEFQTPTEVEIEDPKTHHFEIGYHGTRDKPPYMIVGAFPRNTAVEEKYYQQLNTALQERYKANRNLRFCYIYDDIMLSHKPVEGDVERPERPERLISIMNLFKDFGLNGRIHRKMLVNHEFSVYSPHMRDWFYNIDQIEQSTDIYVNENTQKAVQAAVSALINIAEAIMKEEYRGGVAIVRPPGHHAEYDKAMGYCFINNVAIAANYLLARHYLNRILIVDFDVHHGNGTQQMFYTSSNVLYISIHRDENGKFFPANSPRSYKHDGHGCGKGYNINIPFNKDKMGDSEYLAAFHNIVLPAAYSFSPELVIVSAGFDAGINDPLGGYAVSPETFGHLIWMLRGLANGKLILALEGGYNLTTTSYGMIISTKALIGDPIEVPKNLYNNFSTEAINTIRDVTNHFKRYFDIFKINKKLGVTPILVKKVDRWLSDTYDSEVRRVLDVDRIHDNLYVEMEIESLNGEH